MKPIVSKWEQLSPLTKGFVLFLVFILTVNIFLVLGGLVSLPDPDRLGKSTVLFHTLKLFIARAPGTDSWNPMFEALSYLQNEHQGSVYSQLFFLKGVKFQYPLTSLLPLAFMRRLLSETNARTLLDISSRLSIVITIIFCIKIFNLSLKTKVIEEVKGFYSKFNPTIRNLVLLCLGFTFYPIIKAHTLGQVQVFINLFFTLATWFWLNGKDRASGFLVGLMVLFKPQYALILVWGLLRRKWSFAIAAFMTAVPIFLLSILVFGLSENLAYLNVLKFISQHGEVFYPNQSMNGLLNRLLLNGDSLTWDSTGFAPFNPIVYYGTVLSSFLLISLAMAGFLRSNKQGSIIDFLNITLTCTIASPVAWEHHYGILLPIYAFLLPILLNQPVLGKNTVFYFCISYFLASNLLNSITSIFASIPGLNVLQSYLFFAALIILLMLNKLAYSSAESNLSSCDDTLKAP